MLQVSNLGLLIWMKLNSYIFLTNVSQQIVNFGNGKRNQRQYIFYIYVLFQDLIFYKEFIFCDQPCNKHCKGITKNDLQK